MSLPNWISNALQEVAHTITALAAATAAFLGWSNKKRIQEVHLTMNSRLDELLRSTKERAHDQGRREGIEAEQARMRPADDSEPPKQT